MPRTSLPWLILATVLVSAALAWWTLTRGMAGEPSVRAERRESLPPFHEVEVGGKAEVTLLQSDEESIEVQAAGANGVSAEVANGRLLVRALDRRRTRHAALSQARRHRAHRKRADRRAEARNVVAANRRVRRLAAFDRRPSRQIAARPRIGRARCETRRTRRAGGRVDLGCGLLSRRAPARGRRDSVGQ